jgi:hypothetical protein
LTGVLAKLESVKQALANQDKEPAAGDMDEIAAEWFDSAVSSFGKADALAAELGIDKSYLSCMRSGKKPVALRHLIPLLKSREAVLAFVAPLCAEVGLEPPQPKRTITRAEVLEDALLYLLDSPPLLRSFIRYVVERRGVEDGDVLAALK